MKKYRVRCTVGSLNYDTTVTGRLDVYDRHYCITRQNGLKYRYPINFTILEEVENFEPDN